MGDGSHQLNDKGTQGGYKWNFGNEGRARMTTPNIQNASTDPSDESDKQRINFILNQGQTFETASGSAPNPPVPQATTIQQGATTIQQGATTIQQGATTIQQGATTIQQGDIVMEEAPSVNQGSAGSTSLKRGRNLERQGAPRDPRKHIRRNDLSRYAISSPSNANPETSLGNEWNELQVIFKDSISIEQLDSLFVKTPRVRAFNYSQSVNWYPVIGSLGSIPCPTHESQCWFRMNAEAGAKLPEGLPVSDQARASLEQGRSQLNYSEYNVLRNSFATWVKYAVWQGDSRCVQCKQLDTTNSPSPVPCITTILPPHENTKAISLTRISDILCMEDFPKGAEVREPEWNAQLVGKFFLNKPCSACSLRAPNQASCSFWAPTPSWH